jgi:hypothetical protein
MKKTILFLVLSTAFLLSTLSVKAQNVWLNASTNQSTVTTCNGYFYDDGGPTGSYSNSYDYWVAFCPTDTSLNRVSLTFENADIHISDSIFFYRGIGVNYAKALPYDAEGDTPTGDGNFPFTVTQLLSRPIESPIIEPNGCMTVRFKSSTKNVGSGWKAKIECIGRCQYPVAALDTFFIKFDSVTGTMSHRPVRYFEDTTWNDYHDSILERDPYYAIDICKGDSVILVAKTVFPDNNSTYHQSDSTCIFYWGLGGSDIDTVSFTPRSDGHRWKDAIGYDLTLSVLDTMNGGCKNRNSLPIRLRTAINPIKTVSPLPDMCSGQKYQLNVSHSSNSSITLDSIDFSRKEVQRFDSTIFIPDGPNCGSGGVTVPYYSPVTFTEFPSGAVLRKKDDVVSLCMTIEHSWIGDLGFRIICPNGQSTVLKWNTHQNSSHLGRVIDDVSGGCDPSIIQNYTCCAMNPTFDSNCDCSPGTGWTYCFSNQYLSNPQGTLGNGGSATTTTNIMSPGGIIDSTHILDTTQYFQTPAQTGVTISSTSPFFTGPADSVDLNGFATLIGCPLNGEWNLEIYDNWGGDNGFVFAWWLALNNSSAANWTYQVGLDTVMWNGPFISSIASDKGEIFPPVDSCGNYKYNIGIVDDFGCTWDTITHLNVVCSPTPNLGPDTAVCETVDVLLDPHFPNATKYSWEPTGDTTSTIVAHAAKNTNDTVIYAVQIMNTNGKTYCYGLDSINLIVHPPVIASFSTSKSPLEGCEPLEFTLNSTSENAAQFDWTVGGQKAYTANPSFSFPYGSYDVKLKVTSPEGCTDSIRQDYFINVYKSPKAEFSWTPLNPSVTVPTISFINLTTPDDAKNQYHWKIQKAKQSPLIENIFGKTPSYTWIAAPGANTTGDYSVSLDAYSVNTAPSGFVYECHDTISKVITIINDSLIFPNVLTPNGDGINDVFTIRNLIDGQAYPDNEFSIYNRLGKRIFFRQDLRSGEDVWDPNKTNSPSGTYYYHFVGRGPVKNVDFNGVIEVLRN